MISLLLLANLITVEPRAYFCNSPCDLTITLTVEPQADNRDVELSLVQNDGEYARFSTLDMSPYCVPTESGKDVCKYPPHRLTIRYPGVPAGAFELRATLKKSNGKVHTDAKTVTVQ
jgi:hypothetical protein